MVPGSATLTPATTSIGQTLKSMREAKNISQADIASKMHLDPRFIIAIEEDNFDSLPDVIYVRGYIRSYSKLVGADADALVKQFEAHGGNFEPEIIPEIRHSSQTSSSDKPVKAFTYLVIFALFVLLFAWWQSNYMMEPPAFMMSGTPAAEPQPAATPAAPPAAVPSDSQYRYQPTVTTTPPTPAPSGFTTSATEFNNFNQPLNVAAADTTTTMQNALPGAQPPGNAISPVTTASSDSNTAIPAVIPPVATATDPATSQPAPLDPSMLTPPAPETTVPAAEAMTAASGAPALQASALQPTAPQTTGPDLIVLKLTADSWIEIIDSTGTKVFFNLGRSGDVFNVRGTAPFDVLLGFSQAVTLEYNGKPFDASPHSRAGVARFMLGE